MRPVFKKKYRTVEILFQLLLCKRSGRFTLTVPWKLVQNALTGTLLAQWLGLFQLARDFWELY